MTVGGEQKVRGGGPWCHNIIDNESSYCKNDGEGDPIAISNPFYYYYYYYHHHSIANNNSFTTSNNDCSVATTNTILPRTTTSTITSTTATSRGCPGGATPPAKNRTTSSHMASNVSTDFDNTTAIRSKTTTAMTATNLTLFTTCTNASTTNTADTIYIIPCSTTTTTIHITTSSTRCRDTEDTLATYDDHLTYLAKFRKRLGGTYYSNGYHQCNGNKDHLDQMNTSFISTTKDHVEYTCMNKIGTANFSAHAATSSPTTIKNSTNIPSFTNRLTTSTTVNTTAAAPPDILSNTSLGVISSSSSSSSYENTSGHNSSIGGVLMNSLNRWWWNPLIIIYRSEGFASKYRRKILLRFFDISEDQIQHYSYKLFHKLLFFFILLAYFFSNDRGHLFPMTAEAFSPSTSISTANTEVEHTIITNSTSSTTSTIVTNDSNSFESALCAPALPRTRNKSWSLSSAGGSSGSSNNSTLHDDWLRKYPTTNNDAMDPNCFSGAPLTITTRTTPFDHYSSSNIYTTWQSVETSVMSWNFPWWTGEEFRGGGGGRNLLSAVDGPEAAGYIARADSFSEYKDWWKQFVIDNCQSKGFQDSVGFKDLLVLPVHHQAIKYLKSLSPNDGQEIELYLTGQKSASQTIFGLLTPFYVLVSFAVVTLLLMCLGCCGFSKTFRYSLAHISRGFCCRDRPRRDLRQTPYVQLGAVLAVYVVVLLGGFAMFTYLVAFFALEFSKGCTASQCAAARGSFEMVYGIYWSREQEHWPLWNGTQTTYDRAIRAEFESEANRPVFLDNIHTANKELHYKTNQALEALTTNVNSWGSVPWVQDTLEGVDALLNAWQTLHFSLASAMGKAQLNELRDRLSYGLTTSFEEFDYSILSLASIIANGSLHVARRAKLSASQISSSLYKFIHAINFDRAGKAIAYTLIAIAVMAGLALLLITVLMCALLRVYVKRQNVPSWMVPAAGCNWICYALYAFVVLIIGGIGVTLAALLSKSCSFTEAHLFKNNKYPIYPRLHALVPANPYIPVECLSAQSRGNWTAVLGVNDLPPFIQNVTQSMTATVSDYQAFLAPLEIDWLSENANVYTWLYLIDSKVARLNGHANKLSTYPEVLNGGVQWETANGVIQDYNIIKKYAPQSTISSSGGGGNIYGMEWLENKINEVAKEYSPRYNNWCIQSNPAGCNSLSQSVIDMQMNPETDPRITLVAAYITSRNSTEATYWQNAVFWAVNKQRVVQQNSFPCKAIPHLNSPVRPCHIDIFSPYVTNVNVGNSNLYKQFQMLHKESGVYRAASDATVQTWKDKVIPHSKQQGTPLVSLQNQQCKTGLFDYIAVITGEFCVYAAPNLAFALVFLCALIGVAVIGWMFTFHLWHYLYDHLSASRMMSKMRLLQGEVAARRQVEMDAAVFDDEQIADLMQEMAQGDTVEEYSDD